MQHYGSVADMRRYMVSVCLILVNLTLAVAGNGNAGWMAGLEDSQKVCKVSIPGTHDSGTAGVRFPMRHYARTQSLDLSGQWDAGIRFFDLRPRLNGDKLEVYHGPASCHITFEEALQILVRKLEENPTEFCIVMTNSAGGGQAAVDRTMELIGSVIPPSMLAVFKADMTVADTRGRILFIHRNNPSGGVVFPGVGVRGWPGNGLSRQARMVTSDGENALLWAQDYFSSGSRDQNVYLSGKWDSMYRLLRAFADAVDDIWCINHASGYTGTGISTNIQRNARATNGHLWDYLQRHHEPVGIIPMDFPEQNLIDAIIFLNTFATR